MNVMNNRLKKKKDANEEREVEGTLQETNQFPF